MSLVTVHTVYKLWKDAQPRLLHTVYTPMERCSALLMTVHTVYKPMEGCSALLITVYTVYKPMGMMLSIAHY